MTHGTESSMDARYFFEGMLSREESASAFLATLLGGDASFRQAFLRRVLADSDYQDRGEWAVSVETENVDILLSSPLLQVLIENKVKASAVTQDQLRDYYLAAVTRVAEGQRIAAVYIAPGGVGGREVEKVNAIKRESDYVAHLSWDRELADMVRSLSDDRVGWFASSGLKAVLGIIKDARHVKYPLVGERIVVVEIVNWALAKMTAAFPRVQLLRWRSAGLEQIYTSRVPVTVYVDAVFEAGPEPNFEPMTVRDDGGRSFDVRTKFILAGSVAKNSPLARHWDQLRANGLIDVDGVGAHVLQLDGWFVHVERGVAGSPEEIAARMASIGTAVLTALGPVGELATALGTPTPSS